jgi:hypothetical protein
MRKEPNMATPPSVNAPGQQYYEIRIYTITGGAQEKAVDVFLKDTYIPALHRAGIAKIGVFKPIETDTAAYGKLVYVLIPFKTLEQWSEIPGILAKDEAYTEAGKSFIDAPYDNPPYARYQTILLKALESWPQFVVPPFKNPAQERIYELRSYESATEAKAAKKLDMINHGGELDCLRKVDLNAVFWGEVLAGDKKPNLMYMVTFENMKSHDGKWEGVAGFAEWQKLKGVEEYKNTVSRMDIHLLHPTSYSDF